MTKKIDNILAKALSERKIVPQEVLDKSLEKGLSSGEDLVSILVKEGIREEQLLQILAEKLNLSFLNLKGAFIEQRAVEKVPIKIASYYKFMPIKIDGKTITIAVSYPLDIRTQDEIRMHLGYEIEMVLSCADDIREALNRRYGLAAETIEKITSQTPVTAEEITREKIEDIEKLAIDASVIKLVNQLILEAYRKRATDIHIEPYREKVRVRYRIDGVLYEAKVSQEIKRLIMPILSRIKIMANMNIVERRLPQDGRAVVKIQDNVLDLRISTIPTPYGESIVIRILPTTMLFSLEKLGLSPEELKIFEMLIEKPYGIIFVTGPTGSGKTTTLYASLNKINTTDRKIITIEDPIEYEMEGITQIQVNPAIGLDFAQGLRSMLRHDPDVMMVGEVRDRETAEIAIRVALTGHLVFSTLHTNDTAGSITRLIDIGLEPYLICSSVEAFIAQRLVRTICPDCKEENTAELKDIRYQIAQSLGLKSLSDTKIYKGKGCERCDFTGFRGRTGIYEILLLDEAIKELVLSRASSDQIKKLARARGMRTLRQKGWEKVQAGVTTPEEVMEVTPTEQLFASTLENTPMRAEESSATRERNPLDKRVYVRLDRRINIRYKIFRSPEELGKLAKRGLMPQELEAVTKNISAGGLLFSVDKALLPGSILDLRIELPRGDRPIECLARILRVKEIEMDKEYDIAVCFLDLTSADRARLDKYVKEEIREV